MRTKRAFKGSYSHADWKITDKWWLTCFKSILKISHSKYLQLCSNLPVEFTIFLKVAYFLTVSIGFADYKQNFMAQ